MKQMENIKLYRLSVVFQHIDTERQVTAFTVVTHCLCQIAGGCGTKSSTGAPVILAPILSDHWAVQPRKVKGPSSNLAQTLSYNLYNPSLVFLCESSAHTEAQIVGPQPEANVVNSECRSYLRLSCLLHFACPRFNRF